jgi:hypothetical protein
MKKLLVAMLACVMLLTACNSKKGLATMQHFEDIEIGMTYEEICEIIGAEGELVAEAGSGDIVVQSYTWEGVNANSVISISFTNGVADAKAQTGL